MQKDSVQEGGRGLVHSEMSKRHAVAVARRDVALLRYDSLACSGPSFCLPLPGRNDDGEQSTTKVRKKTDQNA